MYGLFPLLYCPGILFSCQVEGSAGRGHAATLEGISLKLGGTGGINWCCRSIHLAQIQSFTPVPPPTPICDGRARAVSGIPRSFPSSKTVISLSWNCRTFFFRPEIQAHGGRGGVGCRRRKKRLIGFLFGPQKYKYRQLPTA